MRIRRWRLALTAGALLVTGTEGLAQAQEGPQLPPPAQLEVSESSTIIQAPEYSTRPLTLWERDKLRLQECVLGFPDQFKAPPLGASVYAFYRAQVTNGDAARMVLYQFDFMEGMPNLTLRGHDQLALIAGLLLHNHFPVVIERTPWNPALAAARRVAVLNEFARAGLPLDPQRVVVGLPLPNGLSGVEALIIDKNRLQQTQIGATQGSLGGVSASQGSGTPATGSGTSNSTTTGGAPGSP